MFGHDRNLVQTPAAFPVLVVAMPTKSGWRLRSTHHDKCNHDYVSNEPRSEIVHWIECDLSRAFVASDRQEVMELLTTPIEGANPVDRRLGSYVPDPTLSEVDGAERVLRHLEHGY